MNTSILLILSGLVALSGCSSPPPPANPPTSRPATASPARTTAPEASVTPAKSATPSGSPSAVASGNPDESPTPGDSPTPGKSATPGASETPGAKGVITTPTGLKYEVVEPGTGAVAEKGKIVSVHYTGTLESGQKFDSSRDRKQPIEFPLGKGMVIPGWEEGIAGMKVGEKRKLIIPSNLAYGDAGRPPVIPPKATLLFDVELMDVK